ncbi:MAG: hypothetical protein IJU84_01065, partial [Clostridia bacterium]|nr:hypothetical protein [Clostridia bacterium]
GADKKNRDLSSRSLLKMTSSKRDRLATGCRCSPVSLDRRFLLFPADNFSNSPREPCLQCGGKRERLQVFAFP